MNQISRFGRLYQRRGRRRSCWIIPKTTGEIGEIVGLKLGTQMKQTGIRVLCYPERRRLMRSKASWGHLRMFIDFLDASVEGICLRRTFRFSIDAAHSGVTLRSRECFERSSLEWVKKECPGQKNRRVPVGAPLRRPACQGWGVLCPMSTVEAKFR